MTNETPATRESTDADRPRHGDTWGLRSRPTVRYAVMHVCGHHVPPHVTGYWYTGEYPDSHRHEEFPLPWFLNDFVLVEREYVDAV